MIVGNHVYIVEETGIPHCYDLTTGEEVWQIEKRPGAGGTWGSMVHAEGRLYVVTKNAQTLVIKADPKYELLATNSLGQGESSNSSLAISNGDVFVRTFKHLWCLAETKQP
jgi:outer membrane protein assembly factor BamB